MNYLSDDQMKDILAATPRNASDEDCFFSDLRYVPGRISNQATNEVVQPQESFRRYEEVLSQIKRVDPLRYGTMHKGTPFYFLGWLAYEMKNYEMGVFYMDAAVSEDIQNVGSGWMNTPAAAFLFLDETNTNAAAYQITVQTRREVISQLQRFSQSSGESFDVTTLVERFFKPNAMNTAYRSIITSILTFLLENSDLRLSLELRSKLGGTSEPFLTHLFKGGLIFESLLKRKYGTSGGNVLSAYLKNAKADLQLNVQTYKRKDPYQFEELPSLLQEWEKEDFQERAVATAYAVRNTAGHDLAWQDIFTDDLYLKLFNGIVDAILWTIKRAYQL